MVNPFIRGGVNLAVIEMAGKWNLRVKGLKLNDITFPIIELYFNLGYTPNINDQLHFGNMKEFGEDIQIRMNTIGAGYYAICASSTLKPTDITFNNVTVNDTNKKMVLTQSMIEGSNYIDSVLDIRYNDTGELGICGGRVGTGGAYQGYSPYIILHDEFSDKIILVNYGSICPTFYNFDSQGVSVITTQNDVAVTNQYLVIGESTTDLNYPIWGIIDNVLEQINPTDSDPYNPNGQPAGGGGEDQNSDEMQDETLPTISASDTGFVTLYKPSISQMNALASYMWGTLDLEVFKKIFANPMDVILGLSILPGIVPSGGSSTVKVGNIDTGISMTKVGNQYVKFNCGSVSIKKKWGAFLDYSPFTKAFIYLPFIGVQPIDADEIMGKTVSVSYNIDVLSGGCCAFIKVDNTTLYSYIGQCACSVPVTSRDWSTMINGVLGAVSSVTGTIGNIASGNVAGAVSGIASVAQNVMGAKPSYQRSGSMGGMGGMMGIKTPYIIIERPVQAVPGYQNHIIGYPSFITRLIGDFKGYTEIEQCHLENIPCTKDEMNEIESILKSGVIL